MSNFWINEMFDILTPRLEGLGLTRDDVNVETDLLQQGVLDSLSFLEFVVELESRLDVELDISEMDPEDFNTMVKLQGLVEDAR